MDTIFFELRAANKNCTERFSEIAKVQYEGVPIFEHACNYVNNSQSYNRTGRHLDIIAIEDFCIRVKLTSKSKLEMASKSLVGFSRELIRIDQEINPEEKARLFRCFVYNTTLFRNTQFSVEELEYADSNEMSDVEALKLCVEVFCNSMTASKEEAVMNDRTKREVKKLLAEYARFKRMNTYREEEL